jgi:hypothetical protein
MRKRLMFMVAPLCVVAVAASVAFASPSDAEHSSNVKLDNLHAERRDAALTYVDPSVQGSIEIAQLTADVNEYVQAVSLQHLFDNFALWDYLAALPAAGPVRDSAPSAVTVSTGGGDFLSCVRNRESGGNYGIYNSGGSGAAGAYQFLPGTWNSIAAAVGRSDLVGVDPAQASPADQDAMAGALYAQQGSAPWGGYCG